ncbi:hypothetical protein PEDI_30980 [Persicobacter diffluens]|uniref:Uncharacterized protein n=1 Tax=Persicobacter diffluens TaxID=981 RepID=A0AAN5AMM7_9BACT|nr:hypothetical protein PEDI_30980 [Persicobacter diffluens]
MIESGDGESGLPFFRLIQANPTEHQGIVPNRNEMVGER